MIPRHQLAVAPKVSLAALSTSAAALVRPARSMLAATASELQRTFGASAAVLTDSGTSALVLAFRHTVGNGGVIALPGFGCVNLAAAAQFAGVKVRLYDIDPSTMSPDLDSLERTLERGVDAVLVAHLYGYPANVLAVRDLAREFGVPVIEDAAQAAGGLLRGSRLGSFGDVSILSFGRGKGLFGGRGGALLSYDARLTASVTALDALPARGGAKDLAAAVAQWVLGRPEVYAIPSSLPWLHLGEMVYHPAHEPRALSKAAARLVQSALRAEPRELASRQRNAAVLRTIVEREGSGISLVRPINGAVPGYLRFAVLDRSSRREAAERLGIMRSYPRTLHEQGELRPQLLENEPATPGAAELRRTLFTLPTHALVAERDVMRMRSWVRVATGVTKEVDNKTEEMDATGRRSLAARGAD